MREGMAVGSSFICCLLHKLAKKSLVSSRLEPAGRSAVRTLHQITLEG